MKRCGLCRAHINVVPEKVAKERKMISFCKY